MVCVWVFLRGQERETHNVVKKRGGIIRLQWNYTLSLSQRLTASCSSFMNCLLSSLHLILWDPWLHLQEFWTYGEIPNPQTVLRGLTNFLQSASILLSVFCWGFCSFDFSSQLYLLISSDSVNPTFQGHVPGDTIMCSRPAPLWYLKKNGGQGEGWRCPGPCYEEGESTTQAASLGGRLDICPGKGLLSFVGTWSPLRMPLPCSSQCMQQWK